MFGNIVYITIFRPKVEEETDITRSHRKNQQDATV